jgi:SSS family solute:Na+ symporter
MYTDALQGAIMFVGMLVLLVFTYVQLGGIRSAHNALGDLTPLVPGSLKAIGHQGWTSMPRFGWGDTSYDLWWIVVSTITLGVGIGVLALPQLVVRFMTVNSKRELNRAVLIGGVFILVMTGVAFTVGSLSNAFLAREGKVFTGTIATYIDEEGGKAVLDLAQPDGNGGWDYVRDEEGKPKQVPVLLDEERPFAEAGMEREGETVRIARGRSISVVYAGGNPDQIIPTYITSALPEWFGLLFLLTLLAAAMSTLSSQFHALGTSVGRDVYEQVTGQHGKSVGITRVGIIIGIIIAVIISWEARGGYIIARATAIFFGLCASAFLPAYLGGLFWKRMTKPGAIASMITGFCVSGLWLLLVKSKEASAIGLVQLITGGKTSIVADSPNWPVVDPIVIALPISLIVAVVVSLATKPMDEEHVEYCYGGPKPGEE